MNLILFINSIYISNLPIGRIKQIFYKKLQKKYNFDRWHITPINLRPYAIDIVNNLNKYITKNSIKNEGYVIEIGCGLGDIIGHICYPSKSKLGLDLDKRVIAGAKIAHSHKAIFHYGSFHNICGKKYSISYNY